MNFPFTLRTFIFGKHPDIGSDTCVVEKVYGQRDDCFNQVVFQHPAADLALTRSCTAGKQRAAIFNDSSTAEVVVHLINSRLQEQHLHIARTWQARAPATIKALLVFFLNSSLYTFRRILAAPRSAKGWIFDHEPHLGTLKTVGLHGVLVADVFCILAFDHHFRKADCVRFRIDFLTEKPYISGGIIPLDKVVASGKHTARSTGLIQHSNDLAIIKNIIAAFRQQDIDHQLDNVSAGIVIASLGIF